MPCHKFLIDGLYRTGSHMLRSAMLQHPQIRTLMLEPLAKIQKPNNARKKILELYCQYHGFTLHAQHGIKNNAYQYLPKKLRIIRLNRNPFHRAISELIANRRRTWVQYKNDPGAEVKPFYIGDLEFQRTINTAKRSRQQAKEAIGDRPVLDIHYEDQQERWNEVFAEVCQFLDVKVIKVAPTTKKQVVHPEEIVLNYSYLTEQFRDLLGEES
ncbi:sulfotransferase domain-containing protein [Bremerella sp. P1]|uniref:sulfotransferase domain-containing protein n=1 Tax=Bremerella sp. P1 TaxID=3026424 RepID=UPI002367CC6B|nr:sulfotransferase domain-containing protein [Bremerella sp. P1]WDI43379.1 sulfotransferase domain-containing protein [Bremerella sp. P1]